MAGLVALRPTNSSGFWSFCSGSRSCCQDDVNDAEVVNSEQFASIGLEAPKGGHVISDHKSKEEQASPGEGRQDVERRIPEDRSFEAMVEDYNEKLSIVRANRKRIMDVSNRLALASAVGIVVAFYAGGVLFFSSEEGWSVLDTLYFLTVTVTTVGYGDLAPSSDESKLVNVFFVLFGIVMVGSALGMATGWLLERIENSSAEQEHNVVSEENLCVTEPWRTLLYAILCILVPVLIGTLFYCLAEPDEFDFVDAFYMSCGTVTTVGYGDLAPASEAGRVFAIFWILIGALSTANAIQKIAQLYATRVKRRLEIERLQRPVTVGDLQRYGGEDGKLDKNEFTICKLKGMKKCTKADLDACEAMFNYLNENEDQVLDKYDILIHAQRTVAKQIKRIEKKSNMSALKRHCLCFLEPEGRSTSQKSPGGTKQVFDLASLMTSNSSTPGKTNSSGCQIETLSESLDTELYQQLMEYDSNCNRLREEFKRRSKIRHRLVICVSLVILALYYILGAIYYTQQEGWSLIESVYFLTVTVTTVGYGDLVPTTDGAKVMTSMFILVGVVMVGAALGVISGWILEALESRKEVIDGDDHTCSVVGFSVLYIAIPVAVITIFYSTIEDGMGWFAAFHMAVETVTTVGYGREAPSTEGGRLFGVFAILIGVVATGKAIERIAGAYSLRVKRKLEWENLNQPVSIRDLQRYGGEDGKLDVNEFTICKLKGMKKCTKADLDACEAMFNHLNQNDDGVLDVSDMLAQAQQVLNQKHAKQEGQSDMTIAMEMSWRALQGLDSPSNVSPLPSQVLNVSTTIESRRHRTLSLALG